MSEIIRTPDDFPKGSEVSMWYAWNTATSRRELNFKVEFPTTFSLSLSFDKINESKNYNEFMKFVREKILALDLGRSKKEGQNEV